MYFISYEANEKQCGGILTQDGKHVVPLKAAGNLIGRELPETLCGFIEAADDDTIALLRKALKDSVPDGSIPIERVPVLAPIPEPRRNVLCVGKNYADHVNELKTIAGPVPDSPIWFTKLSTSVTGPDAPVSSHRGITNEPDYEAEMAVVIGRKGTNIAPEDAEKYIFGYMCANDVTARDIQAERGQWFDGKSLDTFCPTGPAILHRSSLPYPPALDIRMELNGNVMQQSNTGKLIHSISELISDLSQGKTLLPGDIILTGTPSGVGKGRDPQVILKPGDEMAVTIEHLGTLRNPVV